MASLIRRPIFPLHERMTRKSIIERWSGLENETGEMVVVADECSGQIDLFVF